MKIIRSKAPLRIGLAGGGTDVSPYCDQFTGYVLNATINKYAYCTIETTEKNMIEFIAKDLNQYRIYNSEKVLKLDGELDLFKGIYNRLVKDYIKKPLSFRMTTYSDAIHGSGLGGSSTMVVAIIKAFEEWLHLPFGEYDIAKLAYEIERIDIGLLGGKQDQYAATFGGFNFIEFNKEGVLVNPLRIKNWIINELEASLIICFTGISRESSSIIRSQIQNTVSRNSRYLENMHCLKNDAIKMKEQLLKGNIKELAKILNNSWINKKESSSSISNNLIDKIYNIALDAGALGGKVSGAGGGGFMMFIVDPTRKVDVLKALKEINIIGEDVNFSKSGAMAWTI
ncbi:GHMP family kinase ATP-binding protein [Aliarcobacter cryaerophilus]|uniref:GHMP family kinase ATP-binding protein n=1 Tax=Aliarcobacter cryaerophilus TaxID=28198 RepID=UPI000830F9CA|nr:dehydrogenase [Aliarcobacter cryaerophilus]